MAAVMIANTEAKGKDVKTVLRITGETEVRPFTGEIGVREMKNQGFGW